jgi:hypothetical protein
MLKLMRMGPVQAGAIVTALRRGRRLFAAALALALLVSSPAGASPETLKRSFGNMLLSPLDLVCGPYVGVKSVIDNIQDVEDTMAVRVVYFLPGLGWNIGMQTFAAAFRMLAGILELVPGLVLLPFETDLDPIYALPERQDGLVDIETPVLYFKFCINYVD